VILFYPRLEEYPAGMAARTLLLMAVPSLLALGGCSSTLETGYEPRRLGAAEDVRRGFYAQPFTPQAKAAKEYEQDFGERDLRRPRPGY